MDAAGRRTILPVEDEAIIALAERRTLERNGYEVIVAHSGESAVEIARSTPTIDLILMDINLGRGIDGTEAAGIILKDSDVPLAFLSSHTEPEVVGKTEKITSYGYIVKNSGETVLLASIRMAFRLFESRRLIGDTFANSLNGVCIHRFLVDDDGTTCDCEYLTVNDAFEQHTGLAASTVLGRTIRDISPNDEADDVIRLYSDILAGSKPSRQEIFFAPSQSWFGLSVFPIRGDEFAVVINNITKRKQSEQAPVRSEQLYRILMEHSVDGIKLLNREGRILNANPAACEMIGYSREELLGMTVSDIDPDFPREAFLRFWDDKPDGRPARVVTSHRHKDGHLIPVEVSVIRFDLDGEQLLYGITRELSGIDQP